MDVQRFDLADEVTAERLASIFDGISAHPNEPSELHIMSKGGNLDAAYDFYWAVRKKRIQLNTFVYGEASSAAFIVLLAGIERTACGDTKCLIHPSVHASSKIQRLKQSDLQRILTHLRRIDRIFASIVARESKGTLHTYEVLALMQKEQTLTLEDLLRNKLIHRATA